MAGKKAILRRLFWSIGLLAVGVYLYTNLGIVNVSLDQSGYVLNGDLETGFMRIHTDTGRVSFCLYDAGQTARCLQWGS